ncbi:MAG TPA: LptF/LptG family permease [Cytophagaceae bacterium]|jgi:lipopolysaccharide export system permease protein|nr:LptF/LptG family permease [Cytophagaceae bacterium]
MKKLDRLVLESYIGPFLITLPVIIFIFLVQTILKYIDELVGKDIGFVTFLELIFYFSLNLFPVCLPLAILLGSLIAFGNMGEHNELTAIKSSGISLVRIFRPVFILVLFLTVFVFWFNDKIVPLANLKAYSLLYDLRHKKPALDIKEGTFYNGLPGYSIKVSKKYPDDKSLKGLIIYNHAENRGNIQVIVADSGQMYTFHNNKYLAIELFKGYDYSEQIDQTSNTLHPRKFVRSNFLKSKICFNLTSFDLKKTEEGLFRNNRIMRNITELDKDIDSMKTLVDSVTTTSKVGYKSLYFFANTKEFIAKKVISVPSDSFNIDSLFKANSSSPIKLSILNKAANQARTIKAYTSSQNDRIAWIKREKKVFMIALQQKFTQAIVCILFFMIGAPLGAIIKKGGLGVPMIICIIFFVIFYIITMTSEKWVKETENSSVYLAIWSPLLVLLPFGLFFLRQARNDSKVFDTDIYLVFWGKLIKFFKEKTNKRTKNQLIT